MQRPSQTTLVYGSSMSFRLLITKILFDNRKDDCSALICEQVTCTIQAVKVIYECVLHIILTAFSYL